MTLEERQGYWLWWLEQSGLSVDELRELAAGLVTE